MWVCIEQNAVVTIKAATVDLQVFSFRMRIPGILGFRLLRMGWEWITAH